MANAIVGTSKKFTITPKDELGLVVDLAAFPTALTEIVYTVSDGNVADATVTKPDNTEVQIDFRAAGAVTLSVSARDRDGNALTDSVSITVEVPVPAVKTLNLAEAA